MRGRFSAFYVAALAVAGIGLIGSFAPGARASFRDKVETPSVTVATAPGYFAPSADQTASGQADDGLGQLFSAAPLFPICTFQLR